jgi:hypothetical protein
MEWIGCVWFKKFRHDLVARTFALIALVHPILRRVSCSYEMIPNAPKHYAAHQNMSLGSNGVDWVRSLRKIPTWLRGMKFCISCTYSPYYASSFMKLRNGPKCTQTLCNARKHVFKVQWSGVGSFVVKIPTWLRSTNFCINCTSSSGFASSFMQLRNDPKAHLDTMQHTKTCV